MHGMLTPVCIHPRIQTGNRAHSRTSGISSACQAIKPMSSPASVPHSKRAAPKLITAAWEEQKAIKEVILQGVGVSTSLAVRIFKQYADASIDVVRTEPYRLAADVWGIGFKTADTIAQAVGIPHDSPQRVKAGLQFTLSEATSDGHCFLPEQQL